MIGRLWLAARLAATVVVAARLARAARRPEPLTVGSAAPSADIDADATISAVIPARDEEDRLLPLLQLLATDRSVMEVIVVDDGSRDGTAALARDLGATVITGAPLPRGWVGKPWALDQGLRAARGLGRLLRRRR